MARSKPKHKETAKTENIFTPNPSPMATIHDDDELLLARIGYKQVTMMSSI